VSRTALRELADRVGIIPEYLDQTGREVRRTTDATREALLAIMGFDAPTADAARGWLDALDHEERESIIEPVRVVERDDPRARQVRVRLPDGIRNADVVLTLTEEQGHVWTVKATVRRGATLLLPTKVAYGYHRLEAHIASTQGARHAEQSYIVVPSSCVSPQALLGDDRGMGVVANLYSARREHDWGVGDLTTCSSLVEWAGQRGADFVGINPLHALYNRGWDISPYSPVSRLFRNVLYLDVEAIPAFARSRKAQAILNAPDVRRTLQQLRDASHVDYDTVIELKDRVLTEVHRTFRHGTGADRDAFEAFVRAREPEISRFATWMTIAENARVPDWRQWPTALQDANSTAVAAFAAAHAERIDYHRWLQFEVHRQLAAIAERARVLGMRIGVYQDLAIGTSPGGSDSWSYPDLFLSGAAVGAPPDPYAAEGQNWGLPPIDPRALRRQCYRYWIQLVRRAFEHAGALRIDHVMGLFRAFWIPDGLSGTGGAYVRYPSRDLLGILALESVRHNALVVGEDLGTVPKDVPGALRKWGILSSKVLYFERDRRGFRGAGKYPPLALATANTHDMPTLHGFWAESDIGLRERLGLLQTPAAVKQAQRDRAADKQALLARLGLSAPKPYERELFPRQLTAAVHEFLCATPSRLVGLSLDDLVGEETPVNVPGVGADRYPSWRRRMRKTVEEIGWSFEVDSAMQCQSRRRKPS
jgi:4-alpha-glucanotransferase